MPRFAVCDDDAQDLEQIQSIIMQLFAFSSNADDVSLAAYHSGEALLDAVKDGKTFDVYFIDIMMSPLSGIEIAHKLQKITSKPINIVFTTSSRDFGVEAFEVNAIDYLLKPINEAKLKRALERCRHVDVGSYCITVEKNKRSYRIACEEISYIESFSHECVFHYAGNSLSAYMTMNAVLELLPQTDFVRCHKSFIVNLAYVENIYTDYLVLKDGISISIGRTMRKEIHALHNKYLIRRIWEKNHRDY